LTSSKKTGIIHAPNWLKNRKQKPKEKKAKEPQTEPSFLRIAAFVITLVSMILGLSMLPIFPQPLPAVIALLVAFVTYKKPLLGMPIGTPIIALGLLYHLSSLNFIVMLGETYVREIVVFMFIFLFALLPIVFHRYKDAIAINLGITAAILLFFGQTYYLAVPLIATSAVFFKKKAVLSAVFYGMISMPLMMMQYLQHISEIAREDWWVEAGSSPPIYVSLSQVFKGLAESMSQFRLYDTSKIVWSITGQITGTPPLAEHTVGEVLSHYLDSIPGIALFIVMVLGIVIFITFAVRTFLTKTPEFPGERLLPMFTGVVATALFFILIAGLQNALAFRADVNGAQMAIGTLATVLFTAPALLINPEPKKRATTGMILTKAQELLEKLQVFEADLVNVKTNIPIPVSSIEGRMLVIKDRLNDIIKKTATSFYDISESDEVFNELDHEISNQIRDLMSDLDISVFEYQMNVNGEYSTWTGKLKDMGLEVKTAEKVDFQKEMPLEDRIGHIKGILEDGRRFVTEACKEVEQVYEVLRLLYDPNLPKEGQATTFALQKLKENGTPWISMEALFTALNNWRKQYGTEISISVQNLKDSLNSIASLSEEGERLQPILGDKFPMLEADTKKAQEIMTGIESKTLDVVNILIIRDIFKSSLIVAKDVISILYQKLKNQEETIESLLPAKDYLWEKNIALMEQMTLAMDIFSDDSEQGMKNAFENLSGSLSCLHECVETMLVYNEKKELLLNYPIAENAILSIISQKKQVSATDLPFEQRFAEEYLKLFHSHNYAEFRFDESNLSLMKR
jgi:hypothetical protein